MRVGNVIKKPSTTVSMLTRKVGYAIPKNKKGSNLVSFKIYPADGGTTFKIIINSYVPAIPN